MDTAEDTETLFALVSSLLTGPAPDSAVVLDALVQCNGSVNAAAERINSQGKNPKKKRKRVGDLDNWLKPSKPAQEKPRSKAVKYNSKAASPEATTTSPDSSNCAELHTKEDKSDRNVALYNAATAGPSRPASPSKQPIDLMTVLRQPPPAPRAIPRLPPLMLSNPSLVAQHTPCTLHLSVLPAELACRLFYTMMDASTSWKRNKWWLFDKVVESPHRTSFYARRQNGVDGDNNWQEAAQYWSVCQNVLYIVSYEHAPSRRYNGRKTDPPVVFPDAMEEACSYVENIVNDEMRKRKRFPLEWGGAGSEGQIWRANVAASNCYEGGKESVG